MRPLLAALALCFFPACVVISEEEDTPPIPSPCLPSEEALSLKDGPYGSGVEQLKTNEPYPSFASNYPKRLVFDRATSSARIVYFHEDKLVVEKWTVGPLTKPREGNCNMEGHERGNLQLASITIDGATGELAKYAGLASVTLIAGASVHYRHHDGRELTTTYRHGFAPQYSSPCEFRRPTDGTACNESSICLYDLEGDHCTSSCVSGKWQSFACTK
jgi:hypothetical protein